MQGAYTPNIHIHTRECWKSPVNNGCYLYYIEFLQNELLVIQETLRPIKSKIDRIHTDIQHMKLEDRNESQEAKTKSETRPA